MQFARGTKIAFGVLATFAIFAGLLVWNANRSAPDPGNASMAAPMGVFAGIGILVLGCCVIWLVHRDAQRAADQRNPHPERERYCTRCGSVAEFKHYRHGSELACFLLFLIGAIPGIIYYIWMRSTGYYGCRRCGAREIVPVSSPVAQRSLTEIQGMSA